MNEVSGFQIQINCIERERLNTHPLHVHDDRGDHLSVVSNEGYARRNDDDSAQT